jgi:hypothetical protein
VLSRPRSVNGPLAILAVAAAFGAATPAFATDIDIVTTVTTSPAIDPTEVPLPERARVNHSTSAAPSYASYNVTFTPYTGTVPETFDPVYFRATTTVVNVGEGESPLVGQVAAFDFDGAVLPAGCSVITTPASATSTIECRLTFVPPLQRGGPAAAPLTFTVKAPSAGQRIKFVSETRWFEVVSPHGCGSAPPGHLFRSPQSHRESDDR